MNNITKLKIAKNIVRNLLHDSNRMFSNKKDGGYYELKVEKRSSDNDIYKIIFNLSFHSDSGQIIVLDNLICENGMRYLADIYYFITKLNKIFSYFDITDLTDYISVAFDDEFCIDETLVELCDENGSKYHAYNGEALYTERYDVIRDFNKGYATVAKDSVWKQIDLIGNSETFEFMYPLVKGFEYIGEFSNDIAVAKIIDGGYCHIDRAGLIVCRLNTIKSEKFNGYQKAYNFHPITNMAKVIINDEEFYINKAGNKYIDIK